MPCPISATTPEKRSRHRPSWRASGFCCDHHMNDQSSFANCAGAFCWCAPPVPAPPLTPEFCGQEPKHHEQKIVITTEELSHRKEMKTSVDSTYNMKGEGNFISFIFLSLRKELKKPTKSQRYIKPNTFVVLLKLIQTSQGCLNSLQLSAFKKHVS